MNVYRPYFARPKMNSDEALGEFPKLADTLSNREASSVLSGAVTATCSLDRAFGMETHYAVTVQSQEER